MTVTFSTLPSQSWHKNSIAILRFLMIFFFIDNNFPWSLLMDANKDCSSSLSEYSLFCLQNSILHWCK